MTYGNKKPIPDRDLIDAGEPDLARDGQCRSFDKSSRHSGDRPPRGQDLHKRLAALSGIELSPEWPASAKHSYLRGGLAPWQAKRIRSYIEDNLGSKIRATDLAVIVQMSLGHFFRTFRKTFGEAPHAYITRRRILRAQDLMLSSGVPLAQIALECGMSDQAHFSRVFRRIVGVNPKAWRQFFATVPQAAQSVRESSG